MQNLAEAATGGSEEKLVDLELMFDFELMDDIFDFMTDDFETDDDVVRPVEIENFESTSKFVSAVFEIPFFDF